MVGLNLLKFCVVTLLTTLVAVTSPQGITPICSLEKCQCSGAAGQDVDIRCDCNFADTGIVVGDQSKAYIPDLTSSIAIQNCNNVTLAPGAFSRALALRSVRLSNIRHLVFSSGALQVTNGNMSYLTLEAISNLTVQRRAVDSLSGLTSVTVSSVNASVIPQEAFTVFGVTNFIITNSNIGQIQANAISIKDVSNFNILATNVTSTESNAIQIGNCNYFSVFGSRIGQVAESGIRVYADSFLVPGSRVEIVATNFSEMARGALQITTAYFGMNNCTVERTAASLQIVYEYANIRNNVFHAVSADVFQLLEPIPRVPPRSGDDLELALVSNVIDRPTNKSFDGFLDIRAAMDSARFLLAGNRFRCSCDALRDIALAVISNTTNGNRLNYTSEEVHAEGRDGAYEALYRTSRCFKTDSSEAGIDLPTFYGQELDDKLQCITATQGTRSGRRQSDGNKSNVATASTALLFTVMALLKF